MRVEKNIINKKLNYYEEPSNVWEDFLSQNRLEENIYKLKTLKAVARLEYILSQSKYCIRCGTHFYHKSKTIHCLECRDGLAIYKSASNKYRSLKAFYLRKLGHIPEEKQAYFDFLLGIIKEWRANKSTE